MLCAWGCFLQPKVPTYPDSTQTQNYYPNANHLPKVVKKQNLSSILRAKALKLKFSKITEKQHVTLVGQCRGWSESFSQEIEEILDYAQKFMRKSVNNKTINVNYTVKIECCQENGADHLCFSYRVKQKDSNNPIYVLGGWYDLNYTPCTENNNAFFISIIFLL